MKKYLFYVVIAISFLCAPSVNAATNVTGIIVGKNNIVTKAPNLTIPGNSCTYTGKERENYAEPGKLHCLDANDPNAIILNYDSIIPSTVSTCKKGYYYIKSGFPRDGNNHYGYICADNVVTEINVSEELKTEFRNAGIPESYWPKLKLLKDIHPNWTFRSYNTNIEWKDAIDGESPLRLNLIQSSNPIYLSYMEGSYDPKTQSFIQLDKGGFYQANKETISYYMDPRNFLDEKSVFMFLNLGFNESIHTLDSVKSIIKGTDLEQYANYFLEAATYDGNRVSPIMLAARSKQEVLKNNVLSNSANGTSYLDKGIFYNFYNIGSYPTCTLDDGSEGATIQCGLMYAYKHGWSTAEIAIKEGAKFIAEAYINNNQNTLYFQKFNVVNNKYNKYDHQYMQNLKAPYSEANSMANSYSDMGIIDSSFEFIIPVFNNMPNEEVTLPTKVNEEEKKQRDIEQVVNDIGSILSKAGYNFRGSYLVGVKINETAGNMISKVGNGAIAIRDGVNMDSNTTLGTADVLKIAGNSYRIIVYGDATGDGKVNAQDYVKLRNYIMQSSSLSGSFKEAADVNNDGTVNAMDYVNIRNYIMGNASVLK